MQAWLYNMNEVYETLKNGYTCRHDSTKWMKYETEKLKKNGYKYMQAGLYND